MGRHALAILAVCAGSPVIAQEWLPIGKSGDGSRRYADMKSIHTVNRRPRIWLKIDSSDVAKAREAEGKMLLSFDCPRRKFTLLKLIRRDRDGSTLENSEFPEDGPTSRYLEPGTMYWQIGQILCERKG